MLVVDDEEDNRMILQNYLEEAGHEVDSAANGQEAVDLLHENDFDYGVVLLDWRMPGISGLDVLKMVQKETLFRRVQVIMQTARARSDEILTGIEAGAWYYLTKPFEEETLLAIVRTALADRQDYLHQQLALQNADFTTLQGNRFAIRTPAEVVNLASLLAKLCPQPWMAVTGLTELLMNAVEHGNLGIDYREKSILQRQNRWQEEINHRLSLPEYAEKRVVVHFNQIDGQEIQFVIRDQGAGFDWGPYLKLDSARATHTHGRGIAMAGMMSFDQLEYRGTGNEVLAVVDLKPEV